MNSQVECVLCGGTDFYKEAGFYYCNECQTQTQDIREHVFEEEELVFGKIRKVKEPKSKSKPEDTLTSWECYNYILLGLVNELIELGAKRELKKTVKTLWMKYLKKLDVVSEDPSHIPKLQAVNSQRDAQLIYGVQKPKKRRRRKSSSGNSSSSQSSADRTQELRKRKKTVIKMEQEQSQSQPGSSSLQNQSLRTFQSNITDSSNTANAPIQYNKYAKAELRKFMSRGHLRKHRNDKLNEYSCHKMSFSKISYSHAVSPTILTRKRIFAILYLGLLIIKDKIQLSDMLRYINEGHLSYNEYLHFFPETLGNKKLNIATYAKAGETLSHVGVREMAFKIVKLLDISIYIPTQNIIELSERYCLELNLPDDVHQCVVVIISETLPYKHKINNDIIPNYEARAISYILFVLKLLFGLDGATEYAFTKFANAVNDYAGLEYKMFSFVDWITFIQYRKLVLCDNNFPCFNKDDKSFTNSELFINFAKEYNSKYDITSSSKLEYSILKDLLLKLNVLQDNVYTVQNFPHSLTPFHTYLKTLLNTKIINQKQYLKDILVRTFKNTSLDFLLRTEKFLTRAADFELKHGGANDSFEFINSYLNTHEKHSRAKIPVSVSNEFDSKPVKGKKEKSVQSKTFTKKKQEEYYKENKHIFVKNTYLHVPEFDLTKFYKVHYHPHERFWLRSHDTDPILNQHFKEILVKLPFSFQLILAELARITEQTSKTVYEEYCIVEQYLCYNSNQSKQILDQCLNQLVIKNRTLY